jgi:acetolactate decarboxylase
VSAAELTRHGDLGIGTFDALDGELVLVDGELWRADAGGSWGASTRACGLRSRW